MSKYVVKLTTNSYGGRMVHYVGGYTEHTREIILTSSATQPLLMSRELAKSIAERYDRGDTTAEFFLYEHPASKRTPS